MISMNKQQKAMFDELSNELLHAKSKKEIKYYSEQIHELLDQAEKESPEKERFNRDELKLYNEYKQKLLESQSIEDISFYESKIMNLIEINEKRRDKEV